jgi:CheY-like chemotaxis protein
MVVDDEKDQVFSIKRSMESFYGDTIEIIPAYNGMECIDLLIEKDPPDLIILDVMMSEISGPILYEQLKKSEQYQHIPIMFLTAGTCNFNITTSQAPCFEKPMTAEELKKQIDYMLS